jgi:hypothetical protein
MPKALTSTTMVGSTFRLKYRSRYLGPRYQGHRMIPNALKNDIIMYHFLIS